MTVHRRTRQGGPMRKLIAVGLAAGGLIAAAPAAASVTHVTLTEQRCPTTSATFPGIYGARLVNVPKLTYGYAPRWLLVCGAAGQIQYAWASSKPTPKRIWLRGARWDGGVWRVRKHLMPATSDVFMRYVLERGAQRIVMNGWYTS